MKWNRTFLLESELTDHPSFRPFSLPAHTQKKTKDSCFISPRKRKKWGRITFHRQQSSPFDFDFVWHWYDTCWFVLHGVIGIYNTICNLLFSRNVPPKNIQRLVRLISWAGVVQECKQFGVDTKRSVWRGWAFGLCFQDCSLLVSGIFCQLEVPQRPTGSNFCPTFSNLYSFCRSNLALYFCSWRFFDSS